MANIIERDYCLKNPVKIIKLFGLWIYFGMLFSKRKSLLQRITEAYRLRGIPMLGYVGNAYKISAMIEFRIARIYGQMAESFRDNKTVWGFFKEMQDEENEHGRLMLLCLYTVALKPSVQFIPCIRDPEIRHITRWLRGLKRKIDFLSLEEALKLTEELELSEINTILGKLLKQTDQSESHLFQERMQMIESHGQSVPIKINKLRQAFLLKNSTKT